MTEEKLLVQVDVTKANFDFMLYFVKRNHKLREYKLYYQSIQSLCVYLDKLSPELDKAKTLIYYKKENTEAPTALGKYLEEKISNKDMNLADFKEQYSAARQNEEKNKRNEIEQKTISFNAKDFSEINLFEINSYVVLKNYVKSFKWILEKLKNYESFQGRIKFDQFVELFNFEDYIYADKKFQYSIISNYNKRLIPEFISASFANLVYENLITEEIRRNMEQYFIAIMSNMDYHNFAHISQLKNELSSILSAENNIFYVLGATPQTFNDNEYKILINERKEKAVNIITDGGVQTNYTTEIWVRKGLATTCTTNFSISSGATTLANSINGSSRPTSKLTSENLNLIYEDIKQRNLTNYNLFLVTSTFHVLKTAIEVEKHFYDNDSNKPDNVIFVGNEKFFDMAHNRLNCKDKAQATYHKKKLKSFLYELFLHALDRNAVKP